MTKSVTWETLEESLHRLGGWYASQRVINELKPLIEAYATGYTGPVPVFPAQDSVSSASLQIARDNTDAAEERLEEAGAKISALTKELDMVYASRDDFKARFLKAQEQLADATTKINRLEVECSLFRDHRDADTSMIKELADKAAAEEARAEEHARALDEAGATIAAQTAEIAKLEEQLTRWRRESQELAVANDIWKHKAEEAQAALGDLRLAQMSVLPAGNDSNKITNSTTILDQALAAADRAEAAQRAAEAILEELRAGVPGSYRKDSQEGSWTRLKAEPDEALERAAERAEQDIRQVPDPGLGDALRKQILSAALPAEPVEIVSTPVPQTVTASEQVFDHKTCTECKINKPVAEFHRDAKGAGGRKSKCANCCADRDAARKSALRPPVQPVKAVPQGTKVCTACHRVKKLEEFYKDVKGLHGRKGQCKDCQSVKDRDRKSKR